jgi:histidine triad (HIT) family protein
MPDECVFCKIIAGEIPATIVYRDDRFIAIRDIHPVAPTHLLVFPIRHVASMAEMGAGDEPWIGAMHLTAARLAAQEGLANGYRLVTNTGPGGGQTVGHLHLHVLGGRRMRWPPG